MPNALIVGIDSVIGQALQKELMHAGYTVFGTSRRKENLNARVMQLDLLHASNFSSTQPMDVVYLCAGVTKISSCRDDAVDARVSNVNAQVQLANYFLNQNTHVIFLSSSSVFSGEKQRYRITDTPCPITAHGEYKVEAEKALLGLSHEISIVRLTKVLTPDYPLIIEWLTALKHNEAIQPFHNLYLSPVPIETVAEYLRKVAEKKVYGITHLSGVEDISYLDMARYLANLIAVDDGLIVPASVASLAESLGGLSTYASLDMTESIHVFDEPPDLSFGTTMQKLYG